MEGYLNKKGRGNKGSIFSKKNWKERWFVIDGEFLIYFERLDYTTKLPVNRKGIVPLKECEISEVEHHEKENVFAIKHATRKPVFLHADNKATMQSNSLYIHN